MTFIKISVKESKPESPVPPKACPAKPHPEALYFAMQQVHAALASLARQWDDHGSFENPVEAFNLVELARLHAAHAIEQYEDAGEVADDDWIEVGMVGVDSGTIMIGDPCYIEEKNHPAQMGWDKFVETVVHENADDEATQLHFTPGHAGLGVLVQSGFGDGAYPVSIKLDPDSGRVAEVKVTFIET